MEFKIFPFLNISAPYSYTVRPLAYQLHSYLPLSSIANLYSTTLLHFHQLNLNCQTINYKCVGVEKLKSESFKVIKMSAGPSKPGRVESQAGFAEAVAGAPSTGAAARQRNGGPVEEGTGECAIGQSASRHLHVAAAVQRPLGRQEHSARIGVTMRLRHRTIRGNAPHNSIFCINTMCTPVHVAIFNLSIFACLAFSQFSNLCTNIRLD